MERRTFIALAAMAVVAGCSPASQSSGAGARSSSNVLTRQEIAASPYQNAYEAVEKLRPSFLRPRPTSAGPNMTAELFVDGIRRGSLEGLRAIPSAEIAEIRFLSVQDATTRYGLNVPAGVLDVKLVGR